MRTNKQQHSVPHSPTSPNSFNNRFHSLSSFCSSSTTSLTMQTAIQPLAPPHYTPQQSHRPQYHPHKPITSTMTRPPATAGATLPLPLPTPPVARKRKRPPQYSVSYSEVQEVDTNGKLREVIVIEDTPPPPATISPAVSSSTGVGGYSASMQPPIFGALVRTRAQRAAEAQALGTSTSSSGLSGPVLKKRKREIEPVTSTKRPPVGTTKYAQTFSNGKTWPNGNTAVEDVSSNA